MPYQDAIAETREFTADETDARFDQFLCRVAPEFSRTFLRKLIDDGLATVNLAPRKAGQKLRAGETVQLQIPRPVELSADPENIPLTVLFEDDDLIVIDKPAGIVVHPSPGHPTGTLVNALLFHCRESLSGIGGELRPGIVHRLDQDTSGCLVAAKSATAHLALSEQFAARQVKKKYLAITRGTPQPPTGKVEGYIFRQQRHWEKLVFSPRADTGKYSLTYYRTLRIFSNFALVECEIKTGRTHQIRLHLNFVGAPILCDALYGRESEIFATEIRDLDIADKKASPPILSRQALHAAELTFSHPRTGETMTFTSPLPHDLQTVLSLLTGSSEVAE